VPSFHVLIPARYGSTRLPAKVMLELAGKPMLQWVYEHACQSGAESVTIATDDDRIKSLAQSFAAPVCMTSNTHRSGTDRCHEAATQLALPSDAIVVNVQADEPMLPPSLIKQVADILEEDQKADAATLYEAITHKDDLFDPNIVKVVTDTLGRALYFSRAAVPWDRQQFADPAANFTSNHKRHIGLYAYRVATLNQFVSWPASELEQLESLEQLRLLENGCRIALQQASQSAGQGVDTAMDHQKANQLLAGLS